MTQKDGIFKCGVPQYEVLDGDLLDKTGFPLQNELPLLVALSFSDSTPDRTFIITPAATAFSFWQLGEEYVKNGAQSIQIPDEVGLFVIYYNLGTLYYIKNPTAANIQAAIREYTIVGFVYWDGTVHNYLGYECHGYDMSSDTHANLHFTRGAQWASGLALNTVDAAGTGNTNADAQFGVDLGVSTDEDLINISAAIASTTGLPIFYLDGATPTMKRITEAGYSVLTDVTAGVDTTGRLVWNELTGGSWQLTVVVSGKFVLCHVLSSNDKDRPLIAVVGQATYLNAAAARAGAEVELGNVLSLFPQAEMVAIATVIFQTADAYSNDVQARVRPAADGDWVDWRENELKPGGAAPTDHENLAGLQGGSAGQHYHLTLQEYTDLGKQTLLKITDATVAEGNNSITGFVDKANIKRISVETTSTNWVLTLYEKDDYTTSPFIAMTQGNGDKMIYLDLLYEDQDASTEFHYNFTSTSGAETHDIEVRALELI